MAGKRRHMTKHEYEANHQKKRTPFPIDRREDDSMPIKSRTITERKRKDVVFKKHLQSIYRDSEDLLEDE